MVVAFTKFLTFFKSGKISTFSDLNSTNFNDNFKGNFVQEKANEIKKLRCNCVWKIRQNCVTKITLQLRQKVSQIYVRKPRNKTMQMGTKKYVMLAGKYLLA